VPIFKATKSQINSGGMAFNVYNNLVSLGGDVELHTNKNWRSITKTRLVDRRSNYTVLRVDKNDDKYGRCNVKDINYIEFSAVIISDYNKGYLTEGDIEYISKKHSLTFLDTKKSLGSWCKDIKFIKINDVEYEKTQDTITNSLMNKLIITTGPDGCRYKDLVFPVPEVEIKDAGGAGDTFIAALSMKYVETEDIFESIKFANECATMVVQKKGIATI
jgi:D-beta-D-heptose 7-phosphate kinase/D-beta-D-heptose 1-phosphate adenosyltransferase